MLANLHVKNLALINEADVDFTDGLNILTGETGAGKSIIIDAIGLALGGRSQRDMVKPGESGLAELLFTADDDDTLSRLHTLGVECEDGEIVISRKFQGGRSPIRVNGETRTASDVRQIGSVLIDIHGQSEHQKLLRPEVQLGLLDEYGKSEIYPLKAKVRENWKKYSGIKKKLGGEPVSAEERAGKISFLEYEVTEIDEAALKPGEDEEVEKTYRRLLNSRRIQEAVSEAHSATGYDSEGSAGEQIGMALRRLSQVREYDEELGGFVDQLSQIDELLNDFNRDISGYAERLDDESNSFEETEERLNTINHLKQKYGNTVEEILAAREEKAAELDELKNYETIRQKLLEELSAAENVLKTASDDLSGARKKAAERFSREVASQLKDLNFARADFDIQFTPSGRYSADGTDEIEFVIATNPGEEMRSLRQVVSGGELARIMLGIRTIFADTDDAGTIIFDEIDTGISGRTAQKAAEKMAQIARRHQVLCITHLPQIAAMADTHYGITKSVTDTQAITRIRALDEDASVSELARLIGGAEITANTMRSAKEMKEMCRQYKENAL